MIISFFVSVSCMLYVYVYVFVLVSAGLDIHTFQTCSYIDDYTLSVDVYKFIVVIVSFT